MKEGELLVVGCSSSEIGAEKIGTHSSAEIGQAVFEGIKGVLDRQGVFLAAQCCEAAGFLRKSQFRGRRRESVFSAGTTVRRK